MQDTLTINELTFQIEIEPDQDFGPPWEEHDGHGPVSEWTTRDKLPGEIVLCSDRGKKRYYDFQEACQIARRDGWGTRGDDVLTTRQKAARAALADYEHLRRWCNGQWYWCGVIVTLLDENGEKTDYSESLWGCESDCEDHLMEEARYMAEEIIHRLTAQYQECA